ncbi:hypothetical protein Dxin01_00766 [Deinococcus xinjiangensis]|uniref:DUF4154 domain-containing protein n=1 Tax=Deinococcus xinjiangensis TaxID=457454 RepID=A0ABP9VA28_9DEIO
MRPVLTALLLGTLAQAQGVPSNAQQQYQQLSKADQAAAQQRFQELSAEPKRLNISQQALYATVGASSGEILVVTGQMPQPLVNALTRAAQRGAKVSIITSPAFAKMTLSLKTQRINIYEARYPLDQSLLAFGSTFVVGNWVDVRGGEGMAYQSLSTVMSLRESWPSLLKVSSKL